MRLLRSLLLSAACLSPIAAKCSPPANTYHVARSLLVGGEGQWDYMTFDASMGRLFVTRVGGVDVFDANAPVLTMVGAVPGEPGMGVNRAVLVEDRDFGFTSNSTGNSTTLFRLSTLQTFGIVPLGEETDAAVYDDETGLGVFFSQAGKEAVLFEFGGRKIVGRIPLGAVPEFAVDDHAGHVYVNLVDTGKVAKINMHTRSIETQFTVDPSCGGAAGIDIDLAEHLLFVGCANGTVDIINQLTGATVSTFTGGFFSDAVAYDPATHLVFAGEVTGGIRVIYVDSATKQTDLGVIKTPTGTRTLALDPRTHRVFTATANTLRGPPGPPPVVPGTFKVLTLQP